MVPQNGWLKIMENPIKMDDLGKKNTIFGYIQMLQWFLPVGGSKDPVSLGWTPQRHQWKSLPPWLKAWLWPVAKSGEFKKSGRYVFGLSWWEVSTKNGIYNILYIILYCVCKYIYNKSINITLDTTQKFKQSQAVRKTGLVTGNLGFSLHVKVWSTPSFP